MISTAKERRVILQNELELKALVYKFYQGDIWKITVWWNTPHPDLNGEPPRAFLTQERVHKLYSYVKTRLKAYNFNEKL